MPGFITHNLFGREEYKKMTDGHVKSAIKSQRNVYNLGLQGPDLFFYFPFARYIGKKNLGSMMHNTEVGIYFTKMLDYIEKLNNIEEKNIAVAYFSGFVGHYMLDCHCHPYIYAKTNYLNRNRFYHARHVELETDIDYLMCKNYFKIKINDFPYKDMVSLTRKQREVVADMLSEVCCAAFKDIRFDKKIAKMALYNFEHLIEGIKDRSGKKQKFIKRVENKVIKGDYLSTLFIGDKYKIKNYDPLNLKKNRWANPWKKEDSSSESFIELTEKASDQYQKILAVLNDWVKTGKEKYQDLIQIIGNNSFLNGLDIGNK